MIRFLLLLLIFLGTVALAPILIGEKGYILIAMGNITIESTVVTASLMFVVILIALIFVIFALRGGLKLSSGAWRKVAFRSRRRALSNFQKGINALLIGDNQKAETLLAKSADGLSSYSGMENTAWLAAASAANRQNLNANTKHYLGLIEQNRSPKEKTPLEHLLVTVKLHIDREQFEKARQMLDDNHKLLGHDDRLLGLEVEVCLHEQRYLAAIDHLTSLRKSKVVSPQQVEQWEHSAFSAYFNQLITEQSNNELKAYWQSLSKKLKARESILFAYASVLAKHQLNENLAKILLPGFNKHASTSFINKVKHLSLSRCQELIDVVEKHLHKEPENPMWLSALGHLAISNNDLILAKKAFVALFKIEKNRDDSLAFAKVLEQHGEYQQAAALYREYIN